MGHGHGVLLEACRAALGLATPDSVARAARAVGDWTGVVDAASRHSVLPLVHLGLAAPLVRQAVPLPVMQELGRRFDQNAIRNIELARHLVELGERLAAARIAYMPIKGPALAVAAYGDLSLRQFGDLDLVIHRPDLPRVRTLLRAAGYVPINIVPDALDDLMLGADYHLPLRNDDEGVALEIHWALGRRGFGSLRRDEWAWANATHVSLLGRRVPSLDAGAQIVYLAMHGAKHNWSQLVRVCDIYAAVRSAARIDWPGVRELAARAGASRMLAVGLALCDALLGADLRAHGWTVPPEPAVRTLVEEAGARCLAERALSTVDEVRLQLRVRERLVDRLLFSADVLTSPHVADLDAVRLPRGLRALYYLLRPLRLASKHGRRLVVR